jgi:hypothetical protein
LAACAARKLSKRSPVFTHERPFHLSAVQMPTSTIAKQKVVSRLRAVTNGAVLFNKSFVSADAFDHVGF